MTETNVLSSKPYSAKKIFLILMTSAILIWPVSLLYYYIALSSDFARSVTGDWWEYYMSYQDYDIGWSAWVGYPALEWSFISQLIIVLGKILPILLSIFAIIFYFAAKDHELVVTDHRVYGKAAFGKRVDIPLDSISAISTVSILKGVAVASSSGKIGFLLIKNRLEVYNEINRLLLERQNNPVGQKKEKAPQSNADELAKYKALLDQGVITQEEFEATKKQLLDL